MKPSRDFPRAVVVLGLAAVLTSCSGRSATETAPASPLTEPQSVEAPAPEAGLGLVQRMTVRIYYPSARAEGLIGEPHEIFATSAPGDRAKQIVADLISGPLSDAALPVIPPETQLRQIYVLPDGTAYVDLSDELRQGMRGGSTQELYAVYAIVDSLVLGVPEIRRVGILINGKEIDTLNGHVDLRRPLPADASLILDASAPDTTRLADPSRAPAG